MPSPGLSSGYDFTPIGWAWLSGAMAGVGGIMAADVLAQIKREDRTHTHTPSET